jgi:hypothetical protein
MSGAMPRTVVGDDDLYGLGIPPAFTSTVVLAKSTAFSRMLPTPYRIPGFSRSDGSGVPETQWRYLDRHPKIAMARAKTVFLQSVPTKRHAVERRAPWTTTG